MNDYGFDWAAETIKAIFPRPVEVRFNRSLAYGYYTVCLTHEAKELSLLFWTEADLWRIINMFREMQAELERQSAG